MREFEQHPHLRKLPRHLKKFMLDQNYHQYTPVDHAVWRFVMRQNFDYLSRNGHHSYLEGLRKTGVSIERVAEMYGMNRILKDIGWAAAAVDGFIPPNVFMEFQAHKVLVISADIRTLEHIEYTPAPDIIHEAAGHAPIIADPEYARYLIRFGEIGSRAFCSAMDYKQYEAIRHLSIIKENPDALAEEITKAEEALIAVNAEMGAPSEMGLIRRLHWWTVEYGLIGSLEDPRIYGAGLLSSIGEGVSCLEKGVKKLPYSLDALHYDFDITKPQPQLFVTPDFAHLTTVLEDFADTMALRKGGKEGLEKAMDSGYLATVEYSSGLQVSGIISDIRTQHGAVIYIQSGGKTTLAESGSILEEGLIPGGFGSPLGKFKDVSRAPEDMSDGDLQQLGIIPGERSRLTMESGIQIEGQPKTITRSRAGKILCILWTDCSVQAEDGSVLFAPHKGLYHMAVGASVPSVYAGPADPGSFDEVYRMAAEKTHKMIYNEKRLALHDLYDKVYRVRKGEEEPAVLTSVFDAIVKDHGDDWLLAVEILEMATGDENQRNLEEAVRAYLDSLKERRPDLSKVIYDGLRLVALEQESGIYIGDRLLGSQAV